MACNQTCCDIESGLVSVRLARDRDGDGEDKYSVGEGGMNRAWRQDFKQQRVAVGDVVGVVACFPCPIMYLTLCMRNLTRTPIHELVFYW